MAPAPANIFHPRPCSIDVANFHHTERNDDLWLKDRRLRTLPNRRYFIGPSVVGPAAARVQNFGIVFPLRNFSNPPLHCRKRALPLIFGAMKNEMVYRKRGRFASGFA